MYIPLENLKSEDSIHVLPLPIYYSKTYCLNSCSLTKYKQMVLMAHIAVA